MEQKAKKLYINTSKEMHLSFNLCIVHPELYEWFYENFVNIVILGDSQYFTDFIDNSIDYSYRELMDERVVHSYGDFPEEDSIIRYLIDSIGRDFYSAVWVDKYYIPDNESYMSWHFVHGILVYGYDDAKKTVSFVNFSFEKGIILQEIAYGDFIQAFANGEKHYKQGGGTFTLSET
ncbi:MAG: hypothetical protein FWC41_02095, partial [Firmicutes bacterium]|nr:hypothetical protein [Bacillota bacterium]